MRVTHIYHSGFAVELPFCTLLFDWYKGELPQLHRDLPLVVFVSHEHYDHYGRCASSSPTHATCWTKTSQQTRRQTPA